MPQTLQVFDSVGVNKWCSIKVFEDYFVTTDKKLPGASATVLAFQTSPRFLYFYTHSVWLTHLVIL